MTLLALMYHRARAERFGNAPGMLDAHFAAIAANHRNVLPGEELGVDRLNVCLTFDDGYYDFYSTVFPLLRQHGLRAVLAVPPLFIRDEVDGGVAERRDLDSETAFAAPDRGGFCTWSELAEMAATPHVVVAAHGFSHQRLDAPGADLVHEIEGPKRVLAARLGVPVEAFVLPYGRFTRAVLAATRRHYAHTFRIGGAMNPGWAPWLYRVDADRMESPTALFAPARLTRYRARYWWNRLRGR